MGRSTTPTIEKKKFNHLLSVNIKHDIRKITTKMMKIYAMSMDVNNSVA